MPNPATVINLGPEQAETLSGRLKTPLPNGFVDRRGGGGGGGGGAVYDIRQWGAGKVSVDMCNNIMAKQKG